MPDRLDPTHGPGKFSLWAVLVIAGAVATTVGGGAWVVARTYLQDELEQYRRATEWRLPETLKELGELSKRLNVTLSERKELESLRSQSKTLQEQVTGLESKLKAAQESVALLTRRVAELEGETFEVAVGEARFVVPGVLAIGVKDASAILNEADVQFGRESVKARPGTPFEATVGKTKCTVTLLKITSRSCTFGVSKRTVQ